MNGISSTAPLSVMIGGAITPESSITDPVEGSVMLSQEDVWNHR
jgi:hypothetical protein